ncbi:MAG: glycoside hydrolase family 3 C-terminal domain-containing protein [Ferruginibacter sp.]|nr:glycoside hydrolase family 3 C-terminal domain-containing protein [Ferruginibacter sp.]
MKARQFLKIGYAVIITCCTVSFSYAQNNYTYPFQRPSLSNEKRVDNLVSLLTIEEKIGQMVNNAPAIERLGIPAYNWWNETLHGVARSPYHVTAYPQAIAMAATWDIVSLNKMADYSASEGRAIYNDSKRKGKTGIYLGLTYWTPNINIFRDPRWGRGQETYGEDPFLTGTLGKSFVRGLEGNHPRYLKASACAKHFAVHSGPEWNRSTFNAKVSDYDLWDTYLPAFRDLIVDAKVSGVMCAYNAFDGQPCCGSDQLMNNILRKDWKFTGYVTSDCGGIGHFWRTHKTHPNQETAAADAVLHGTDCECAGNPTYKALTKALKDGLISEKQIDISLKRLFTIRMRLGMFDPGEMVPFSKTGIAVLESAPHKAHALKMARQSIVLLKNERNLLPLSKSVKKIAVVGPNADDKMVSLANYYGYPSHITTVLAGIRQKLGGELVYEKGINLVDNNVFKPLAQKGSFAFNGEEGFNAEYFQNTKFEGKPLLTRTEQKIDKQWGDGQQVGGNLIARNLSIRFTTTFTPEKSGEVTFELKGDDACRLFIDGEKKFEPDAKNSYYTFNAEKGKPYKLVIEYWQHSDNAEIKFEMGTMEQASPETIAARVKDADVIIFVGGISAKLEGEDMPVKIEGFKGGDRTNIALPAIQTEMMKALKATGKPVVFVNMSGSAIGFEWEAENIPAILQAWYGGQAGGEAVADILFGDYNPAGRLPVTFYKNVNDLPDFEDYSMDNRTYRYFKGEALYPFGFGLSYTSFQYKQLNIEKSIPTKGDFTVKVNVSNTGKKDGDEVVQLYVSHKNAGVKTAIRALKGFQRIHLKAGETKLVTFKLASKDLSITGSNGKMVNAKGDVEVSVGGGQPSKLFVSEGKVIQKIITTTGK